MQARFVAAHLHGASGALRHIDQDDALSVEFAQAVEEPGLLRRVARAERLQDDRLDALLLEDAVDDFAPHTREERQDENVAVHQIVWAEWACGVGPADEVGVVLDMNARLGQGREVVGAEGVEALGVNLRCAIAAQQTVFEEDAHFGHHRLAVGRLGCCNLNACQEVFLAVRAQLADGQLRASEDDGLAQILEHETQGRCREGHRVRAMQDDETIVAVVFLANDLGNPHPVFRLHIARVDGRAKHDGVDMKVEPLEFGHVLLKLFPVEVLKRARFGILNHTNGATRIDEQDGRGGVVHKQK